MLNLEATSKQIPEKVVGLLKAYFGSGGLGLNLSYDSPSCLTFEGGGGYVAVTLCADHHLTRVGFETREWEFDVRRFAGDLK